MLKGSSITRYLLATITFVIILAYNAGAAENVSWQSKTLSAGKIDLTTGGYQVRRTLGVANFSPEFAMPIELNYNSKSNTTGIFGYRWNSPQLESRVFPNKNGAEWLTPWGENILISTTVNNENNTQKTDEAENAFDELNLSSAQSEWKIIGKDGNWEITGRENKIYEGWSFTYNDSRLSKIVAPSKRIITFNYSGGKLTSVSQNYTPFISIDYNENDILSGFMINGVRTTVGIKNIAIGNKFKDGAQTAKSTDRPELIALQHGTLEKETFSYDSRGWLNKTTRGKIVDNLKISTKQEGTLLSDRNFKYQVTENPANVTDVSIENIEGQTANYNYNKETGVLAITNFAGLKESIYYYRRYDVAYNGKLRQVVDAKFRVVANYRYDNDTGNLLRVRDMIGNETFYKYNKKNQVIEVSRLEEDSKEAARPLYRFAYAENGNPSKVSLLDKKGSAVLSTEFVYDDHSQVTELKTQEGAKRIEYTHTGLVNKVTDRFGRISTRSYDGYNRLKSSTDFYGAVTTLSYDENGQLASIKLYEPKSSGAEGELTSSVEFTYDSMGEIASVKDNQGRVKKYEHDDEGRITKEFFADDTAISYSYTKLGQLDKVQDRRGNPIKFAWSKFGSMKKRTTAIGQQNLYDYDKFGLIKGVRSLRRDGARDRYFSYTYDKFDRIAYVNFGDGRSKSFTYARDGKLINTKTESKEETLTEDLIYDEFDRIVKQVETKFNNRTKKEAVTTTERKFNKAGKRAGLTITFPDSSKSEQKFEYDNFGRLTQIEMFTTSNLAEMEAGETENSGAGNVNRHSRQNGRKLQYQYDEFSRVSKQIVAGTPIRYNYDNQGRLTEKYIQDKSGEMLANLKYFYNKTGEIIAREINGQKQNFEYDLRGQLLAVKSEDGVPLESYKYDAAGNVLEKTVFGQTTYLTYDAANQLLSQRTADGALKEFAYDAAGRLVKEGNKRYNYGWLDKVLSVTKDGETVAEFSYSSSGQLSEVKRANGNTEKLYWNDLALIRRDRRVPGDSSASASRNVNTKDINTVSSRTTIRQGALVADPQASASEWRTENYLNEPYVTGGNPVLSWREESDKTIAKDAATRLLFNDMLGSTVATLGGTSQKSTATGLTLFGEGGGKDAFFTGKPQVAELGYTFLFRNYKSSLNKWQTADPLGYPDGFNNFAYVNNEVYCRTDAFGLAPQMYVKEDRIYLTKIETSLLVSDPGAWEWVLALIGDSTGWGTWLTLPSPVLYDTVNIGRKSYNAEYSLHAGDPKWHLELVNHDTSATATEVYKSSWSAIGRKGYIMEATYTSTYKWVYDPE